VKSTTVGVRFPFSLSREEEQKETLTATELPVEGACLSLVVLFFFEKILTSHSLGTIRSQHFRKYSGHQSKYV